MFIQARSGALFGLIDLFLLQVTSAQTTAFPDDSLNYVGVAVVTGTDDQGHTNTGYVTRICMVGSIFETSSTFFGCCGSDASKPCFATAVVDNTILYDKGASGTSCDSVSTVVTDTIYESYPAGGKSWHAVNCVPATKTGLNYTPAGFVAYRTIDSMPAGATYTGGSSHKSGAGSSVSKALTAGYIFGPLAGLVALGALAIL